MAININQFTQEPVKGQPDLQFNPTTLPCQVVTGEATALVPGQAVKLVDSLGGVPKVTAVTADTDDVFGVVTYNIKNASFPALTPVEISAQGNVVWMEASAAIARGAKVMVVVSGQKVATATVGKTVIGFAYDKASASGDLIRVYLLTFTSVNDALVPAANVAASAFTAVTDISTSGGNTYSDAAINAKIALINSAITTVQTTLNAEIAALKAAGLQASS